VKIHFVDLRERPLSPGELQNICRNLDPEELLDRGSQEFLRRGLAYQVFDPLKEILKDPLLLRTPVVRYAREVTVGSQPQIWQSWLLD
jgi:arsenate reductase